MSYEHMHQILKFVKFQRLLKHILRVPQIFLLLVCLLLLGGSALHINNLTTEYVLPLHMVCLLLYMTVSF